jgi:hypothetical protein
MPEYEVVGWTNILVRQRFFPSARRVYAQTINTVGVGSFLSRDKLPHAMFCATRHAGYLSLAINYEAEEEPTYTGWPTAEDLTGYTVINALFVDERSNRTCGALVAAEGEDYNLELKGIAFAGIEEVTK